MKVQKNNLQECADNISQKLEERIKKIMAIEYHYNLLDFFKEIDKFTEEEQLFAYELLMNDYLKKIKDFDSNIILDRKQDRKIDDITDFFDYDYYSKNKDNVSNDEYYDVMEEAEYVVANFISKIFNQKGRTLTLPVTIQNIKDYGVSSVVPEKDMKKVIYWIILKLAVIYNYYV